MNYFWSLSQWPFMVQQFKKFPHTPPLQDTLVWILEVLGLNHIVITIGTRKLKLCSPTGWVSTWMHLSSGSTALRFITTTSTPTTFHGSSKVRRSIVSAFVGAAVTKRGHPNILILPFSNLLVEPQTALCLLNTFTELLCNPASHPCRNEEFTSERNGPQPSPALFARVESAVSSSKKRSSSVSQLQPTFITAE